MRAIRTHRLMRDAQIMGELRRGRGRIRDITATLYADIDPRLHGAAALNVLAHLIRLVKTGAVIADGPPAMTAEYRPAAGVQG